MLTARSTIQLQDAGVILDRLCAHMVEHGDVRREGATGQISLTFGTALVGAQADGLDVMVTAEDETGLSYMKMGVVHHVREFAAPQVLDIGWNGDGAEASVPAYFREMRVVRAVDVTPHMRRVVLAGENLSRFALGGLHVRLIFPPQGREPIWPQLGGDGCPVWPEGEDALTARVYTLRDIDLEAGEVSIDILRHDDDATPGSRFAATARPGDRVGMTGPGGGAVPAARSMILLGDETALPAIARILAALPAEATARAVIEVSGPEEEQVLPSAAAVRIEWLHRDASGARKLADVLETTDAAELQPDTFIWAGCEFEDFLRIRRRVRTEWKLSRDRHLVTAYWRRGAAGDEARADA
jgi:NADPH-dependent ferric siderophore reductase